MLRALQVFRLARAPVFRSLVALASAIVLSGCSGGFSLSDLLPSSSSPSAPSQATGSIGTGQVKVGLILPLSGSGNAAVAAQSMRNAAEMALAEFNSPDIQLLVKDDGGSAAGAQQAAQQALDEGAEIILGPLFALTVGPVGQLARARSVQVIAFSTDANVAARGVYLLSFLPESDVDRIISYAAGQGKRSFAALVPDNAYGTVVEAAFKQVVGRRGGRVRRARALSARQGADAGAGAKTWRRRRRAPTPSSFRTAPTPWQRRRPRSAPAEWTPSACSCSAPACGKTAKSSPMPSSGGPGTRVRN